MSLMHHATGRLAEIRDQLHCPQHGLLMERPTDETMACPRGCRFPIINEIARFAGDAYADSFGAQWNTYRQTQLDSYTGCTYSKDRLERCLGAPIQSLKDSTVLEVGAGAGRFTEWLAPHSGALVAMDFSTAVEANRANCSRRGPYLLMRADINASPLPEGIFDVVICLGVIQHTPSPEQTILSLAKHVAPGGTLVIDHYTYRSRYSALGEILSMEFPARSILRRVARNRPDLALRATKLITAVGDPVLRQTCRQPLLNTIASRIFPSACYYHSHPALPPDIAYSWNELDTFDKLTDWFKHRRTLPQIQAALTAAGLVDVTCWFGGNGVEARAHRPTAAGAL